MPHVVSRRPPVGGAVVVVLEGALATGSGDIQGIVAQAVGQRFCIGVVERELQSMAYALAQNCLQRLVVHRGAGFRDQQVVGSDAYGWVDRVHAEVRVVVKRSGRGIAVHQILIDVAVVLNVLALFAQVSNLQRQGSAHRIFTGETPFLHVRRLDILRINIERAPITHGAAGKTLLRCARISRIAGRRSNGAYIHCLNKRSNGSQTLIGRVALKELVAP